LRRRSLSEVIGAVIVLAVVVLAALSLLRLGSQVVLYAERVSSSQFAREAAAARGHLLSAKGIRS